MRDPIVFKLQYQQDQTSGEGANPSIPSDAQLIKAAQNGALDAFNHLIARHEAAVFSLCLRLLRDVEQAEDATQDTFVRAWSAIGSFRGEFVRPWFLRIATNRAYDLLRTRARRPSTSLDAEPFEIEPQWTTQAIFETPETFAARSELAVVLERALNRLPEDQRVAIVLSDIQGLPYEDIANITSVAVGTVKSRVSRGRTALRAILRESIEHRELFERYIRLSQQEDNAD